VKAYGGMPNLLVGKTCQAKLNEEVENIDDSTKPLFKPSNKTNEHYLKFTRREDKSKEKVIVLNKENITLLQVLPTSKFGIPPYAFTDVLLNGCMLCFFSPEAPF
jgi:hypothetical protein